MVADKKERNGHDNNHRPPHFSASFSYTNYNRLPTGCLDGAWDFTPHNHQNLSNRMSTRTKDKILTQPSSGKIGSNLERATPTMESKSSNLQGSSLDISSSNEPIIKSNMSASLGSYASEIASDGGSHGSDITEHQSLKLPALKSGEVHVMYKGSWEKDIAKQIAKKR